VAKPPRNEDDGTLFAAPFTTTIGAASREVYSRKQVHDIKRKFTQIQAPFCLSKKAVVS
jgi:hypothetical protein